MLLKNEGENGRSWTEWWQAFLEFILLVTSSFIEF
jgi:hypothetical protein